MTSEHRSLLVSGPSGPSGPSRPRLHCPHAVACVVLCRLTQSMVVHVNSDAI